ncbi:MAG: hypothetical protein N3A71_00505 [Candidatus Dojkabacteria bacterium]|nr:hypothetical protein [Candidatus Dojkabacteria bacterium]
MKKYIRKRILRIKYTDLIQPLFTLVILGFIGFLIFNMFGESQTREQKVIKEIYKIFTFDEMVQNMTSGKLQILTNGVIYFYTDNTSSIDTPNASPSTLSITNTTTTNTPTPTKTTTVERKLDNHYFYTEKGNLIRVEDRNFGANNTIFVDKDGSVVVASGLTGKYIRYPEPADDESDEIKSIFLGMRNFITSIYPIGALINDYKNEKFFPVERANNIFSGKWRHPLFTSDKVLDVIISVDGATGFVDTIKIATVPETSITLQVRTLNENYDFYFLPQGYKEQELDYKYRTKNNK